MWDRHKLFTTNSSQESEARVLRVLLSPPVEVVLSLDVVGLGVVVWGLLVVSIVVTASVVKSSAEVVQVSSEADAVFAENSDSTAAHTRSPTVASVVQSGSCAG